MRKILDTLYWICGILAGIFMVGIMLCILTALAAAIFGFAVRSMDEFAGYSMAAASFLGFSYTFHVKEHIRVSLLIERLSGAKRKVTEIWSHALGAIIAGFFAWYSIKMTIVSWQIKEMSQGLIPLPLWIPQSSMALGTIMLACALIDDLVRLLRAGLKPQSNKMVVNK